MKDTLALFALGAVVAIGLALGFVFMIKKAFIASQPTAVVDSSDLKREHRQRMNENERKQDQMMRQLKQRIRDGQR